MLIICKLKENLLYLYMEMREITNPYFPLSFVVLLYFFIMKVTIVIEEVLSKDYVVDVEGVENPDIAKEIASSRVNTLYDRGDIELDYSDCHCHRISAVDCVDTTAETQITIKQHTTVESILRRLSSAVSGTERLLHTKEELHRFAQLHTDVWNEDTSEYVIAEAFTDFFWNSDKPCRRCSVCGKLMRTGYCLNNGDAYYCSDECLHTEFTDAQWEHECDTNADSYYSTWE